MREKLTDARGETLVEALVSILICSLSVLLLFSAAGASANIGRASREADGQYYGDLSRAERQGEGDAWTPPPDVKITVSNGEVTAEPPVVFYGTERLLSYAAAAEGGGA